MITKIALAFIGIVVLAAAGSLVYFYYSGIQAAHTPEAPQAMPDNAVIAGPVTAISTTSITLTKQDGASATLRIASTAQVLEAAQGTAAPMHKKLSDIKSGMRVLVTPASGDASVAQSILLVAPPPGQ